MARCRQLSVPVSSTMISKLLLAGVIGLLFTEASAQTPNAPPAPRWPANGVIPPNLAYQYVFLDSGGDIVVALPVQDGGSRQVVRVPWHNKLAVEIQVASSMADGVYRYDYSLNNTTASKDAVTTWQLVVPADDPAFLISRDLWFGGRSMVPIATQFLFDWVPPGVFAIWGVSDESKPLMPGQVASGFWISSAYKPGLTTAYVASAMPFSAPSGWPDAVLEQLSRLGDRAWSDQHIITIGPRFLPTASRVAIAADFARGIQKLIETRQVNPDSALLDEILGKLRNFREEDGDLAFAAQPVGRFEVELSQALSISLKR